MSAVSLWRTTTWVGSAGAAALTAHTLFNVRAMRTPADEPPPCRERVSVLLPVRDEERHVAGALNALIGQIGVDDLEVLVLDDGSTDRTAQIVREIASGDRRVRLLTGVEPPADWLGKPFACHQLSEQAKGDVLVFVDADVRLAPHAIAATVALLRTSGLDLISPYPRQLAVTPAERLVQPLLQWSWLTTLPLRVAERSPRESLSAANGQFIAVDAAAYRRADGHRAVRGEVLEDVALLRALKRAGGHGGVVDGSSIATCRMYEGWAQVRDGYAKSLWSAFGSRAGATAVIGTLGVCYVVPPVAALTGSAVGLGGYAAAVAGRYAVAERTRGRSLPDSLAHPVSIGMLGWLTALSWRRRRAGTLQWRGRRLSVAATVAAAALTTVGLSGCGVDAPSADLRGVTVVSSPTPAGTTALGSLIEGFPRDVVRLPAGATVTSSTLERGTAAGTVTVSMTATTRLSAKDLLAFYRTTLARSGFAATENVLPPGTTGAAFGRSARDLLIVAIMDRGDERSFSVGGTLTP